MHRSHSHFSRASKRACSHHEPVTMVIWERPASRNPTHENGKKGKTESAKYLYTRARIAIVTTSAAARQNRLRNGDRGRKFPVTIVTTVPTIYGPSPSASLSQPFGSLRLAFDSQAAGPQP